MWDPYCQGPLPVGLGVTPSDDFDKDARGTDQNPKRLKPNAS